MEVSEASDARDPGGPGHRGRDGVGSVLLHAGGGVHERGAWDVIFFHALGGRGTAGGKYPDPQMSNLKVAGCLNILGRVPFLMGSLRVQVESVGTFWWGPHGCCWKAFYVFLLVVV